MGHVIAGRYELFDMIARGGMGSVWVARDLRDGHTVAVKLLHQVEAVDLLRFVREAGLRMDHLHIAAPTGWAAEDDQVAFAMPLVRGGSAADLMRGHGPLPTPFVAEVLRQLLSALDHVHAQGWVHRDVKPGNLLLDPCGPTERPRLRLTDFGIAVAVDEPRLTQTVDSGAVGTPGYMPPESSTGDVAPGADLYAAGITGKVLLTGTRPRQMGEDIDPGPLRGVLQRLTDPDPARRYGSAREALADLQAPDLAWPAGGAGVLVPDLVGGPAARPAAQVAASTPPAPPARLPAGRVARIVAAVAAVLVLVVGAAVAVPLLCGDDPADTSTTAATSGEGATASAPSTSSSPSPTPAARLTSTWAKGRVAIGAGCVPADKGLFAVTRSGGVATCAPDGRWHESRSAPVSPVAVRTSIAADPVWSAKAQTGGDACDEVGEYAVATGNSWLLRCNGTSWTPEVQYPKGDGSGQSDATAYTPVWAKERVPFGESCRLRGQLMVTKGGYPARCVERTGDGLVWAYAPKDMPVHWDATASQPPSRPKAPAWAKVAVRPEHGSRCTQAGQYAIERDGWLVRCRDARWTLERHDPAPPGQQDTPS